MKFANFCIVGRSNVGKSTFFNCFSKNKAVAKNEREVTRDNKKTLVQFEDFFFYLIDTGGLNITNPQGIQKKIQQQIEQTFKEVDGVFFLLDAKEGYQAEDKQLLYWLKKKEKKIYCLVNKIDNEKHEIKLFEFYELGVEKLYPISAAHRIGIYNFFVELAKDFPIIKEPIVKEESFTVSLFGKTNVGKSSLLNSFLQEKKMITEDAEFTTRDAVLFSIYYNNKKFYIFDTVGMRKKRKITNELEKLSTHSSLQAMANSQIILLIMDITKEVSEQDLKIAALALRKNKSLILVFNKLDLAFNKKKTLPREIIEKYPFLNFCPIVFTSASQNIGLKALLDKVLEIFEQRKKKIATVDLNKIMKRIQEPLQVPHSKKKGLKIYYCTQVQSNPPVFRFFVNNKLLMAKNYEKFVKNQFRYYFNYIGTPIRFLWNNK